LKGFKKYLSNWQGFSVGNIFDKSSQKKKKKTMQQEKENMPEKEMDGFEDVQVEDNTSVENHDASKEKKDKKKHKKDKNTEALEALLLKYDELNDKYLRLFSEFDNFRKRTLKEKIELSKTASEEVITALLPVVDDFDRAIQSLPADENLKSQFEGISLIQSKLHRTLEQKGLAPIEAKGLDFDTDFHEALTNIPAPDPSLVGKVIDVVQNGYTLNGKVIRFAKVVIGS